MASMTVGGREFNSKAAAQNEAKRILNETPQNTALNKADFNFMMDWFKQTHEAPETKFGVGVDSIVVRMNYKHSRNGVRGFWLIRNDNTSTDISYLPKRSKYVKVLSALRTAVQPSIDKFKETSKSTGHVDHAGEWTFSKIVTEFENRIGVKIETLDLVPHSDGDMHEELADKNMAARFRAYHDSVATLEAIEPEENIKKGNRIGKQYPTAVGGKATLTKYNVKQDAYQSATGLWWQLVNGVLVGYYGLTSTGKPYQVKP